MAHSKITVSNITGPRDLAKVFEVASRLEVHLHAGRLHAHTAVLELEPDAPVEELVRLLEAHSLKVVVAPGDHLADVLSPREAELMSLLTAGLQVKEIAREMGVQTHTAREYWLRVKRKWDVKTVAQAVALWQDHKDSGHGGAHRDH